MKEFLQLTHPKPPTDRRNHPFGQSRIQSTVNNFTASTTTVDDQTPNISARMIRIALVDNHRLFRDGLTLRLQRESDFEIVGTAAGASEALSCVVQESPNLVIMDLHLPGEDGLRATREILKANPVVKVLVLTGAPDASAALDALAAGACGFLRKTESSAELIRAVRVVMSGNTYLSLDASTAVTKALVAETSPTREPVLSEREIFVLRGLADGLGYKEIADELSVSPRSIETYRVRLTKKTGCASRAELVRYGIRKGIVTP